MINILRTKNGSTLSRKYIIPFTVIILLACGVLVLFYFMQKQNDKSEATAQGESIVASISTELRKCYDTTVLMNDLYKVKGQAFLDDFSVLCAEFQADNLAIGSMYWAPNGIIKYSYPKDVETSTQNFQMLKDSIQGPKAQATIKSKKATIAGPHKLVEGGTGLIIRNPYFNKAGKFEGFAIMVVDTKAFCKQIMASLNAKEKNYRFAVWKDDDPTAQLEEGGYIFSSNGPIENREIVIPFEAPNDNWYLTIEPINGWQPLANMRYIIVIVITIALVLLVFIHILLTNINMTEEMDRVEKENRRMSELQAYQKELMAARDAAEAANRSKTLFINNMSHDIRTPMNAILGFAELMEKKKDDPAIVSDYLKKIKDSSEYLLTIINNVLDMARIESGKAGIEEEFFDFKGEGNNIIPMFEEMASKKHITLKFTEKITHRYVWLDKTKQHQIVMNLLSNALKYTPDGGSITCSMKECPSEREGYGRYVLTIADTGIGMSEEFLEHIFDNFSRERNTTESKVIGTGLGMSIVKKLIDLLGGKIDIKSKQGKGTTFIVTMEHRIVGNPDDYLKRQLIEPYDGHSLEGKRILLAEDNDLNAEITIAILEEMGIKVDRAVDGVECVKMLTEAEEEYYDCILMDVQMPNLNGYDATLRIREMDDMYKADTPIIAMTANAFEEDRKSAFLSGMNDHVAKPVDVADLISKLQKHIK